MKTLVLGMAILLMSMSAFSHDSTETFSIKSYAYDSKHPDGCVYAIVNEKNEIVSPCFSDQDYDDGLVQQYLKRVQSNDQSPFYRIKLDAYDSKHPDGCVYAIVNDQDVIVSPCFSYNDYKDGTVKEYLKRVQSNDQSPFYRIKLDAYDSKHPDGCVYAIVNEQDEIVSPCFSFNDYKDGTVKEFLKKVQSIESVGVTKQKL